MVAEMHRRAPVFFIAVVLAQASGAASAHSPARDSSLPPDGVFWTAEELLRDFFPSSERVSYRRLLLTPEDHLRFLKATGADLSSVQVVYVATTGERVDGYAFLSKPGARGTTASFGVKLSANGCVHRVEVMRLSDRREQDVLDVRFLRQFRGQTLDKASRLRRSIDKPPLCGSACGAATLTVARALFLVSALRDGESSIQVH